MRSGFSRKRVYQCSHGRASAYVGGQNPLTSDVIYHESLKEAFNQVAKLPEDEQRYIVEIIKEEIASEKRWQTLFHDPRSERVLGDLVAEALAEDAARETEEIIGDSFLS